MAIPPRLSNVSAIAKDMFDGFLPEIVVVVARELPLFANLVYGAGTLLLAILLDIQTMQAILKHVKMREAASLIQREVGYLLGDVSRLTELIVDLERQFGLASKSLDKAVTSTSMITSRRCKIERLELEQSPSEDESQAPKLVAGE